MAIGLCIIRTHNWSTPIPRYTNALWDGARNNWWEKSIRIRLVIWRMWKCLLMWTNWWKSSAKGCLCFLRDLQRVNSSTIHSLSHLMLIIINQIIWTYSNYYNGYHNSIYNKMDQQIVINQLLKMKVQVKNYRGWIRKLKTQIFIIITKRMMNIIRDMKNSKVIKPSLFHINLRIIWRKNLVKYWKKILKSQVI